MTEPNRIRTEYRQKAWGQMVAFCEFADGGSKDAWHEFSKAYVEEGFNAQWFQMGNSSIIRDLVKVIAHELAVEETRVREHLSMLIALDLDWTQVPKPWNQPD